jgi:hypothetical protein
MCVCTHTHKACGQLCVLHESENSNYFTIEHQLIVYYNQGVGLLHGKSNPVTGPVVAQMGVEV